MSPEPTSGWRARARARRAARALERQRAYQEAKAARFRTQTADIIPRMRVRSAAARARVEAVRPVPADARVLEVGSGAHGLIFFFGTTRAVGVDPLAADYAALFPAWQSEAATIAAFGEALPFPDAAFDVVLCDNVIDHAERPDAIVWELARVLAPGGALYFTVNVHHPVYHAASRLHGAWTALGIPLEITPFADHTVHLTPAAALRMFGGLPLRTVSQSVDMASALAGARAPRHMGDRLKRFFYKNAVLEVVALRT